MKKLTLLFVSVFFVLNVFSQGSNKRDSIDFEKPLNFFAAAGASYRFGDNYNVAISPIDYTVQFEKIYPVLTRFSLGLVWNPIENTNINFDNYKRIKLLNPAYKVARKHLALALLVNVFQLGYTSADINTSTPIDVGFGLGYRSSNFLILGTIEFTPMRTPRQYFIDQYKDKNKSLVLAGANEPVRTISSNDNSLFMDKVYPSIGIKIAYSFNKEIDTQKEIKK